MPTSPSDNDTKQWIISTRERNPFIASQIFIKIITFLQLQSDVEIIQIISPEIPTKAIIRATNTTITTIQSILGKNILISPDKPLQLF